MGGLGGVFRKSGFTPAALAPVVWLKADGTLWQDSARTTPATADGDPVGAWDDVSGNDRHLTQGTGASRPVLKLAIQNGRPVVRFDGTNDFLTRAFTLAQPAYFALVAKAISGSNTSRFTDGGVLNGLALFVNGAIPNINLYFGTSIACPVTMNAGTFYVVEVLASGASSYAKLNGGTASTGSPGTLAPGGLTLGANPSGGSAIAADISEIVLCAAEPSASDRTLLQNYLNAKWGVY
jgi:hypothetical protein